MTDFKLLGVKLNNSLTWDKQLKYLLGKISKRFGLLKRAKKFLSLKARTLFYHSLIQPVLDYGPVAWGSWKKQQDMELVKEQKRCARVILDKNWDSPSEPFFRELNIMPFNKRVTYLQLQHGTRLYKTNVHQKQRPEWNQNKKIKQQSYSSKGSNLLGNEKF